MTKVIKPDKIVVASERECHLFGEFVAVCWNLDSEVQKEIIPQYTDRTTSFGENDILATDRYEQKTVYKRKGPPYISLVDIYEHRGFFYISDDSPVSGGIDSVDFARGIANNILRASDYLAQVKG